MLLKSGRWILRELPGTNMWYKPQYKLWNIPNAWWRHKFVLYLSFTAILLIVYNTTVVLKLTVTAHCAEDPGASFSTRDSGHPMSVPATVKTSYGHGDFLNRVVFPIYELLKTHMLQFLSVILSLLLVPVSALIMYLCSNTIAIYLCSLCRCWFYIYQFSDRNVNRCKAEVKQGLL